MTWNPNYKFDLDLEKEIITESELYKFLTNESGTTVEVKHDYGCSETGRLAIEFKCRGKLSGISTTEAEWYAFILGGDLYKDEVVVLIKTDRLKKIVRKIFNKYKKKIKGGDDNLSEMILIETFDLLRSKI